MEFNEKFEPIYVYFRIGDKLDYIVVEGYSLVELLTEIGGLVSFIYGIKIVRHRPKLK